MFWVFFSALEMQILQIIQKNCNVCLGFWCSAHPRAENYRYLYVLLKSSEVENKHFGAIVALHWGSHELALLLAPDRDFLCDTKRVPLPPAPVLSANPAHFSPSQGKITQSTLRLMNSLMTALR